MNEYVLIVNICIVDCYIRMLSHFQDADHL